MTSTEARPRPAAIPLGQAVGQAQAVLSQLLTGVLKESGTDRETFFALQRMARFGDAVEHERYVYDLAAALQVDLWGAGELASRLVEAGMLETADGIIRISSAGHELRGRILASSGRITAIVTETIDQSDVATTIRTLEDVAARGRGLLGGRD